MSHKIVTEQDAQNLLANLGGVMGYTVRKSIIDNWLSCLQPAPVNDGEVKPFGYVMQPAFWEGMRRSTICQDQHGSYQIPVYLLSQLADTQFQNELIDAVIKDTEYFEAQMNHVTAQRDQLLKALKEAQHEIYHVRLFRKNSAWFPNRDSEVARLEKQHSDNAALIAEIEGAKG